MSSDRIPIGPPKGIEVRDFDYSLDLFQNFELWTHGNCRYGNLICLLFSSKEVNVEIFDQFSPQKVIYGPYGSYFLAKSQYMDRTDIYFW